MLSLYIPPLLVLLASFLPLQRLLPLFSAAILVPIFGLFRTHHNIDAFGGLIHIDDLGRYVLLLSSIVGIGITLALENLDKHSDITKKELLRFYRFFAIFWIGLITSIAANSMGLYWVGLELATLSTVYMIKTNKSRFASKEAWNYLIVGTIAISLILFGIILIYASAKKSLGDDAMLFSTLLDHTFAINAPLFEVGFAFVAVGMFIKLGFFPMNIWLANIERAAYYPVGALFSGILESAIIIGFFRFSRIAATINQSHLIGLVYIYAILTLLFVSFLIFRVKDFLRLFSLSGIEHMVLITLFWVSGAHFAALLHLGGHALLKPALFLSSGVLENGGKYRIFGTLRGFYDTKGKLFVSLVSLFLLAIVSLPPSPLFFSELDGFGAMVALAKESRHLLLMFVAVLFILALLSIIFYKFIDIYQNMRYQGKGRSQQVYMSELGALLLFGAALLALLSPWSFSFLRSIV